MTHTSEADRTLQKEQRTLLVAERALIQLAEKDRSKLTPAEVARLQRALNRLPAAAESALAKLGPFKGRNEVAACATAASALAASLSSAAAGELDVQALDAELVDVAEAVTNNHVMLEIAARSYDVWFYVSGGDKSKTAEVVKSLLGF